MIVIKASGGRDVRELRKLAQSLSAEPADISLEDLASAAPAAPTARKASKPSVSTLPGARISEQTREAIMKLQPVEVEAGGEYELS